MVFLSDVVVRTALPLLGGCVFAVIGAMGNRAGVFGNTRRHNLAYLISVFVVPVVIFHELGSGLRSIHLGTLLIVATHNLFSIFLGGVLGWVAGTALRLTSRQKHFVMIAAGFGSSGIVPPMFSRMVCRDLSGVTAGPGFDGCSSSGNAYAAVGLALSTIGLYTAGVLVLAADLDVSLPVTTGNLNQDSTLDECLPLMPAKDSGITQRSKSPPRNAAENGFSFLDAGPPPIPALVPRTSSATKADSTLPVLMLQLPKIKTQASLTSSEEDNWHEDSQDDSPAAVRTSDSLHNLMNLVIGSAIDEFFGMEAGADNGVSHGQLCFGQSRATHVEHCPSFPTAPNAGQHGRFPAGAQDNKQDQTLAPHSAATGPVCPFSSYNFLEEPEQTPAAAPVGPGPRIIATTNTKARTAAKSLLVADDHSHAHPSMLSPAKPPKPNGNSIGVQIGPSFKAFKDHSLQEVNWRAIVGVTLLATVGGLLLCVSPTLQASIYGAGAPLGLIGNAAKVVSYTLLPALMIVLGGVWGSSSGCLGRLPNKVVGLVVGLRMLLLPVAGHMVLLAARSVGLRVADPMVGFVSLLQYSLPTSLLLSGVAGLIRKWESAVAQIMLWELIAYTCLGPLYMWNNTQVMQTW